MDGPSEFACLGPSWVLLTRLRRHRARAQLLSSAHTDGCFHQILQLINPSADHGMRSDELDPALFEEPSVTNRAEARAWLGLRVEDHTAKRVVRGERQTFHVVELYLLPCRSLKAVL